MGIWIQNEVVKGPEGLSIVATPAASLTKAASQLGVMPESRYLKVRSGEHLVAILLAAIDSAPLSMDADGGVDLEFEFSDSQGAWPFGEFRRAAVEIKSLPGKWRKHEYKMAAGAFYQAQFRSIADVLEAASQKVKDAAESLTRKVSNSETSRNVFLTVHPMDGLAIEVIRGGPIIGHLMPELSSDVPVDHLWVYWHPGLLSKWSQSNRTWTDYLFGYVTPEEMLQGNESIEAAEDIFLEAVGWTAGSPWRMVIGS